MKLSAHFSMRTLTRSDAARDNGFSNAPPLRLVRNLALLPRRMDSIQALLHRPLTISSGFRSTAVNAKVGGSTRSHHTLGLAADFTCRQFGSPFQVCRRIASSTIPFDQLIYEFGDRTDGGWIHVSFAKGSRRKIMTICLGIQRYRRGLRRCAKPAP